MVVPQQLHFYSADWALVCNNASLMSAFSHITKIDRTVLGCAESLNAILIGDSRTEAFQRYFCRLEDAAYPVFGISGLSSSTPGLPCGRTSTGLDEILCSLSPEIYGESRGRGDLGYNEETGQGGLLCSSSQQPDVPPCIQDNAEKCNIDFPTTRSTPQLMCSEGVPEAARSYDAVSVLSILEDDTSDDSGDYEDYLFSFSDLDTQPIGLDPPFSGLTTELTDEVLAHFSNWLSDCSASYTQSQNIDAPTNRKPIKMEDFFEHMKLESRELTEEGDIVLIETPVSRSMACPFYIYDKTQHLHCLTRNDFRTIRDLKQHIWTVHRQPYYCPTCGTTFPRASMRDQHITTRTCSRQQWNGAPQGLSESQLNTLAKRCKPGTTETTEWFEIWNIIFPKTDMLCSPEPPHTPYLTGVLELAVSVVREYWSRMGTQIIADFLEQRKLRDYDVPNEERNLSALYQVTGDNVVDQLVCNLQENNRHVKPIHSIGATLSSLWKSLL
ncbi:HET-domain-containing protein [Apiospora marii]|uniref:HET-domain-containing protein n=1 Tax=Apiospora marii TaxID=335849 RepID=A0ABR1SU48_9PEZI